MRLSADTDASRRRRSSRSRGRDRGRGPELLQIPMMPKSTALIRQWLMDVVSAAICRDRKSKDLVDTALDRSICSAYILESAKRWMGVFRAIVTCCESIMACEVCFC